MTHKEKKDILDTFSGNNACFATDSPLLSFKMLNPILAEMVLLRALGRRFMGNIIVDIVELRELVNKGSKATQWVKYDGFSHNFLYRHTVCLLLNKIQRHRIDIPLVQKQLIFLG